jgi:FkbM family methyltransferase
MKLIYDLGAHEGLNLPYYLAKARKVVAVEANAQLASQLRLNFAQHLRSGRLVVVEAAIVPSHEQPKITFWVNEQHSFLSTTQQPLDTKLFKKVEVSAISVAELFQTYGHPDFVKVDLEGFDAQIIAAMFRVGIMPESMQVEGWDPAVFGVLSGIGRYSSYKIVNGPQVRKQYKSHRFRDADGGLSVHSFPYHSAGPVGDEVSGPWFAADEIFKIIGILGPGWYDLHASSRANATQGLKVSRALLISSFIKRVFDSGAQVENGARKTWDLRW